jgi:hypothetical protein
MSSLSGVAEGHQQLALDKHVYASAGSERERNYV